MTNNTATQIAQSMGNTSPEFGSEDRQGMMPMKYVSPFYGDVYGAAFFGPVGSFGLHPTTSFGTEMNDAVSALAAPFFSQRRAFYQSVPTEETSLLGRERRKQQQTEKRHKPSPRPFHYLSAVCGSGFPIADVDPYLLDGIPAVHSTAAAENDAAVDVASLLQQLLSDGKSVDPNAMDITTDAPALTKREQWDGRRGSGGKGIREGVLSHSDDVTECIAVLAPKIKRKRICKDGAYKRKKASNGAVPSEGRSSRFRGVTKHRRSGRWEAHIWIKDMGRQVYLGGYEKEEHAAEAYDVAAIKSKGEKVKTNFELAKYDDLKAVLDSITMDELVMIVRRQSQGFSRGTSVFRGVTHHPSGRWEARIGIPGSKHIYLGLYNDEFEAAKWYDRALVRLRGPTAATNFLLSNYHEELTEYHEVHNALLQDDGAETGGTKLGVSFEHWVKFGRRGSDTQMDPNPDTTHATRPVPQPCAKIDSLHDGEHLVTQLVMRALTDSSLVKEKSTSPSVHNAAQTGPSSFTDTPSGDMHIAA